MRPYKRYGGDPRWITTKYSGTCVRCGGEIQRGDGAFYYPATKAMYCDYGDCGRDAEADFTSAAADEFAYSS